MGNQASAGISSERTHFKLLEKMKAYIALTVLFALLAGTEPAAGGVTDAVKEEIVNKHNKLRKGVQPTASNMLTMTWNEEAAANAQKHADKCTLKHSVSAERKISTSGCGENMFFSSNERSWSEAIQSWYDEVQDFQHGVGSVNGGVVGHYTQVVWYRSNEVGCAMSHCPNEAPFKYFYVCQYCPAGNMGGVSKPYKVGPTCGDCPDACEDELCNNPCPHNDRFNNCPSLKHWCGRHAKVTEWCKASCTCTTEII